MDPAEQHGRIEGFGQDAVGADEMRPRLVHRLERTGEQQHGQACKRRPATDELDKLVPVPPGHGDIGQHQIRCRLRDGIDRPVAIRNRHDDDVLLGKGQFHDPPDRDAVVGEEDSLWHLDGIGRSGSGPQISRGREHSR